MKKVLPPCGDTKVWELCGVPDCSHVTETTFGNLCLSYCPLAMVGEEPHNVGLPGFLVTEFDYADGEFEYHRPMLTGCFDLSCDLDIRHMHFISQHEGLNASYLNYPPLEDLAAVLLHLHSRSNC